MTPMPCRTLVIIATYQESENLPALLDRLLEIPALEVLVIDDNSPDGTGKLAEERASTEPRLAVLHRPEKSGVTSAHVLGFRYALAHRYDMVVEMDADFSHLPEDVPRLVAACRDADIAVGSRSAQGARILGRSRFRNALTRFGSMYARFVLGLPVRDCTGGFRCTRRPALEAIDLSRIHSHGYGFQIELNYAWARAGVTFTEVPVLFRDRVRGESKMSAQILREAFLIVPRLRLGLTAAAVKNKRGADREPRGANLARWARAQAHLRRIARFASVGASGVVVNMLVLYLLVTGCHLEKIAAAVLATEAATMSNFLLHDQWTYTDCYASRPVLRRLLRFQVTTLIGVALALSVFTLLVTMLSLNYLLANLLGIGGGTIWYYFANSRFIWAPPEMRAFR